MTGPDSRPSAALFAHMAQTRAARVLALGFWALALGAVTIGKPGAALGLGFLGGLFHLARPSPSAELDKETGRGP